MVGRNEVTEMRKSALITKNFLNVQRKYWKATKIRVHIRWYNNVTKYKQNISRNVNNTHAGIHSSFHLVRAVQAVSKHVISI